MLQTDASSTHDWRAASAQLLCACWRVRLTRAAAFSLRHARYLSPHHAPAPRTVRKLRTLWRAACTAADTLFACAHLRAPRAAASRGIASHLAET